MKVRSNYREVKPKEEVPGAAMREAITADDGAPNFCMRVIEVEPGASSPFHSHGWEHEVLILSGQGTVKGEQGDSKIEKDSVIFVPSGEEHSFINTSDEPLRFV